MKSLAAELNHIKRSEKLTSEDRKRIKEIESILRSNLSIQKTNTNTRKLKETPSVSESIDNIDKIFNRR